MKGKVIKKQSTMEEYKDLESLGLKKSQIMEKIFIKIENQYSKKTLDTRVENID